MSTELDTADHGTRAPTRTSTALAVLAGLAVVTLLVSQVDHVFTPILSGSLGALCLAASLWLVSWDRWETAAGVLAGFLTLPVALGLFAALVGTILAAVNSFLPIESSATISLLSLTMIAQAGVVGGCVLAVLGTLLGIRNVVDAETLVDHYWVTIQTGLVPAIVGALLAIGAVLTQNTIGTGGGFLADFLRWLFAPRAGQTHLMSSLTLVALALAGLRAAVSALPIAELLADSGTGETEQRRVSQLLSVLGHAAFFAGVAALVSLAVELFVSPPELSRTVGYGTYQLLVGLSTIPLVRFSAVVVAVLCLGVVLVVRLLQRLATNSTESVLRRAGPFGAGVIATVGGLFFGQPLVDGTIQTVGSALPSPFDNVFFGHARELAGFFGEPTLAVIAAALLASVTAGIVLALRFAVFAGYLSDETAGYSLASGGLIVAAAFAGTLVSSAWVIFVALVGGLFVWDMGRYGTTLGDEVGRHAPTRDTELVHAGGTLAVGLFGAGAAYGIQRLLSSGTVEESPTTVVALAGVLAGIVFLVAALR